MQTHTEYSGVIEQTEESLPQHWLDSQRLMVGLTLALLQEAGSAASFELMDKAFNYLRPPAGAHDAAWEAQYHERLETIHPATLQRLADLPAPQLSDKWASHLPYWQEAHLHLQNDGERFPLLGAQLLADRIVNSRLTPAQIQQIGIAELSADWQGFFPYQEFGVLLKIARQPKRSPHLILEALHKFRVADVPPRWKLVENALLQKLFVWPLLVLETERASLEFSLPVLLQTDNSEDQLPAIVGDGPLDAQEWEVSVRRATYVAKRLWQNKHKAAPHWLRTSVEKLSASIDLGHAAKIVQPYDIKLKLTGESAEAYFALVILGSLIDPTAVENICATGKIGSERHDPEGGGDHELHEPGYVKDKFLYARDSHFFSTFLTCQRRSKTTSFAGEKVHQLAGFDRSKTTPFSGIWVCP